MNCIYTVAANILLKRTFPRSVSMADIADAFREFVMPTEILPYRSLHAQPSLPWLARDLDALTIAVTYAEDFEQVAHIRDFARCYRSQGNPLPLTPAQFTAGLERLEAIRPNDPNDD